MLFYFEIKRAFCKGVINKFLISLHLNVFSHNYTFKKDIITPFSPFCRLSYKIYYVIMLRSYIYALLFFFFFKKNYI